MSRQTPYLWSSPGIAGGRVTLRGRGVLTSVIYERWKAGETVPDIAADYQTDAVSIIAAVHYELGRRDKHKPLEWKEAMKTNEY